MNGSYITTSKHMNGEGFNLDLSVNDTGNSALCTLHHVTYAPAKFEVATFNG